MSTVSLLYQIANTSYYWRADTGQLQMCVKNNRINAERQRARERHLRAALTRGGVAEEGQVHGLYMTIVAMYDGGGVSWRLRGRVGEASSEEASSEDASSEDARSEREGWVEGPM